jgi:hypothetical protein
MALRTPSLVVEWIDAENQVTYLHDWVNIWALKGWRDFFGMPTAINSYEVPLLPGERFSSVELKPREVDLPLQILETSRSGFIEKMRELVSAFNPDKGEGRLRIRHAGHAARELKCRYLRGLEGDGGAKGWGPQSARVVITLRASDPFWYAPDAVSSQFVWGEPATFFPFFPLSLNASPTFDDVLTNDGDHTAWPVWTIQGPGTTLILTNETTGYSLEAALALTAGQIVTIDTRPGVKTVKDSDDVNYFSTLTATSVLWGLRRGNNSIHIEFAGSDSSSLIGVSYSPPYLSM